MPSSSTSATTLAATAVAAAAVSALTMMLFYNPSTQPKRVSKEEEAGAASSSTSSSTAQQSRGIPTASSSTSRSIDINVSGSATTAAARTTKTTDSKTVGFVDDKHDMDKKDERKSNRDSDNDSILLQARPIGVVRSIYRLCVGTPRQGLLAPHARGRLELNHEMISPDSVLGLDGYSHIWIIFLFHLNTKTSSSTKGTMQRNRNNNINETTKTATTKQQVISKVSPPALGGKKVGIFCTRSPHHPNPIGLTLCKLDRIEIQNGKTAVLHLSGLDLVDGTPVLDIKPHVSHYDCANYPYASSGTNVAVPTWVQEGLTKERVIVWKDLAKTQLEQIVSANDGSKNVDDNDEEGEKKKSFPLDFYGPPNALEDITLCIEEVLKVDVRSTYQTKKLRNNKFQAERAGRLREVVQMEKPQQGDPNVENKNKNEESSGSLPPPQNQQRCTQQLDNLLISFTISPPPEGESAEASAGSGAEDIVTIESIELLQRNKPIGDEVSSKSFFQPRTTTASRDVSVSPKDEDKGGEINLSTSSAYETKGMQEVRGELIHNESVEVMLEDEDEARGSVVEVVREGDEPLTEVNEEDAVTTVTTDPVEAEVEMGAEAPIEVFLEEDNQMLEESESKGEEEPKASTAVEEKAASVIQDKLRLTEDQEGEEFASPAGEKDLAQTIKEEGGGEDEAGEKSPAVAEVEESTPDNQEQPELVASDDAACSPPSSDATAPVTAKQEETVDSPQKNMALAGVTTEETTSENVFDKDAPTIKEVPQDAVKDVQATTNLEQHEEHKPDIDDEKGPGYDRLKNFWSKEAKRNTPQGIVPVAKEPSTQKFFVFSDKLIDLSPKSQREKQAAFLRHQVGRTGEEEGGSRRSKEQQLLAFPDINVSEEEAVNTNEETPKALQHEDDVAKEAMEEKELPDPAIKDGKDGQDWELVESKPTVEVVEESENIEGTDVTQSQLLGKTKSKPDQKDHSDAKNEVDSIVGNQKDGLDSVQLPDNSVQEVVETMKEDECTEDDKTVGTEKIAENENTVNNAVTTNRKVETLAVNENTHSTPGSEDAEVPTTKVENPEKQGNSTEECTLNNTVDTAAMETTSPSSPPTIGEGQGDATKVSKEVEVTGGEGAASNTESDPSGSAQAAGDHNNTSATTAKKRKKKKRNKKKA